MLRELHGGEKGQSLVILGLTIMGLMGFIALAVDGGRAYAQRRVMQNAADAGALAGARSLALYDPSAAVEAATEYAVDRNDSSSVNITVDGQDVTVAARRDFSTFFAGVLDQFTMSAGAEAKATFGSPAEVPDDYFFPVALKHRPFVPCTEGGPEYHIWDSKKEAGDDTPSHVVVGGQRGWLNFDGGSVGASELVYWVNNGYHGTLRNGDFINGSPGTVAVSVHAAAQNRIGDTVIVPIYDTVRPGELGSGTLDYHIVSFGKFTITSVQSTGSPKKIRGCFETYYVVGDVGISEHNGYIAIKLIR